MARSAPGGRAVADRVVSGAVVAVVGDAVVAVVGVAEVTVVCEVGAVVSADAEETDESGSAVGAVVELPDSPSAVESSTAGATWPSLGLKSLRAEAPRSGFDVVPPWPTSTSRVGDDRPPDPEDWASPANES